MGAICQPFLVAYKIAELVDIKVAELFDMIHECNKVDERKLSISCLLYSTDSRIGSDEGITRSKRQFSNPFCGGQIALSTQLILKSNIVFFSCIIFMYVF